MGRQEPREPEGTAAPVDVDAQGDEALVGTEEVSRKNPLRWIVPVLIVLVLFVVPAAIAASPKACGSCHAMKPYYTAYSSTRHRASAEDCLYCHSRPGRLGRMVSQLGIYRCVVFQVAGRRLDALGDSTVSCSSCVQVGCHSMNRLESYSGKLKVNHRAHAEDGDVTCVECHRGTAHDGVRGLTSLPPMELCEDCHADQMDNCQYCHASKVLPKKQK